MHFFRKLFQRRQRCDPEPPPELVDPLANLSPEHILANLSPEHIDGLIAELARRTIAGVPHPTHMNIRFRSHEWALLNIKQLGYDLGRRLASANLSRVVEAPPDTVLKTSVCKQADIESDWCLFWCQEMKTAPFYHRKIWEFCYICQVLWHAGKLSPGNAGCGIEPLPSLFAKYGATIVATDVELSDPASQNWAPTGQAR
jgi:hypothetical protein